MNAMPEPSNAAGIAARAQLPAEPYTSMRFAHAHSTIAITTTSEMAASRVAWPAACAASARRASRAFIVSQTGICVELSLIHEASPRVRPCLVAPKEEVGEVMRAPP